MKGISDLRNLSFLNDFTLSARFENVVRHDLMPSDIWIEDFVTLGKKQDGNYLMKITFGGYVVIRTVLYKFKFTVNLVTDHVSDVEAIVPVDLAPVLEILKTDFCATDSKILKSIMQTVLSFYDNDFFIMAI